MSIDNSVYIGPYIKVKNITKVIEHFKMVNESNNRRYGLDVNFDPTTGEKLVKKCVSRTHDTIKPNPFITDASIVDVDIDDAFWTPEYIGCDEYTIFLPNYGDSGKTIDAQESVDIDLVALNYETKISKFKKEYSKYISYYKKVYGNKSVECCYGVVLYSN